IVNFAAETHVDRSIVNPRIFLESNTIGTFNLLEAARKYNPDVRFIQVSTDEVYSDISSGSYREVDRLKPSSPYAASKAAADMFCLAYHRTYGLDVIITRCTNNFGPYQFPEKLIPKTIIRAIKNLPIPIYGSGKNIRDWIYVLDHCEALDIILKKGRSGEIYNISAGNEIAVIDIVKSILKILDKPENLIMFVEDRPGHDFRYSLDSSKIRSELGWTPRYEFSEALEYTVKWYIYNENWWKPLVNERVLHPTPWKLEW
ncbi:MAG TPA: dTDP-glucose 4,6-dehydratase, partial [Thermoprotei archaeon]|nr:dTDP-glucose 4,6-dehydratase [Thermoprotei archaeon]